MSDSSKTQVARRKRVMFVSQGKGDDG